MDGGRVVVSKNSEHDIYGRTTKIEYTNESGKSVYSEDLKYKDPQINRVLETTHSWMLPGQNRKTFSNAFEYDDLGRLAKFTTNDAGVGNAEYDYDILGRLVSKFEKDTTLTYTYASGSYKPTAISANGNVIANALKYDVRGNVWLDGYNKSAYTLNSTGLPEHVALYRDVPSQLSLADVDEEIVYDEEFGHIKMAYDESGNRVWDRKYTRGGLIWDRVTIPGFGTYNKSRYTDFELERLELVGGGFRNGLGTEAVYPLMDAQGNVRAYAGLSGIKTAYDYRPFGRENALTEGMEGDVDNRRWQDKEYDGEHGKYFFGARYFDPFFGLWMSPDPAGQYANPYTYGGDPVNFIDPTGLWGFDTGFFTIGWDSNRGWNFGMSAGIFSYTWYQNGSKTFEARIGGSYQWYFLNLGGSIGYSYNTYSGHSLSAGGHVCVGAKEDEAGVCAGLEAGANMYWDAYGNFLGATAYAGPFAELQASDNTSLVKVNGGYETGLFGMEGRGWYGGVSAKDGSLYASWAENGGWSYGATVVKLQYNSEGSDYLRMSLMGYSFNLAERLKADVNFHRENYALKQSAENGNYDEDGFFVIAGHGRNKNGKGYILNEHTGALMDAEAVAEMIKADPRYNEGMNIKLASCQNSIMAKELSLIFKNVIVKGPSDNLVSGVLGDWIENGGTWDSYMNGKLVSSQKNGIFSRFWN